MTAYFQAALAGIVVVASIAVAVAAGALVENSVREGNLVAASPEPAIQVAFVDAR